MSGDGGSPGQQPYGQSQWQGNGQGWPGYGPQGYGRPGWGSNGGWGHGPWGAPIAPKPGVLPLRPLSFGEMFGAVFETLRRYFKALYLPLLAVTGGLAVLVLLVSYLVSGQLRDALLTFPDENADLTGAEVWKLMQPFLWLALVYLVAMLVQYVFVAPLSVVVLRAAVLGRPLTAGQAWQETRTRLWPTAATLGLLYGGALLAFLVLGVVPLVVAVLIHSPWPLVLSFVLWMLTMLAFGYTSVRLVPQVAALVLEETTATGAIRRAWKLNRGNWWRSLGLTFLVTAVGRMAVNVATTPLSYVIMALVPISGFDRYGQADYGVPSSGALLTLLLLGGAVVLLGSAATAPLAPLAGGVIYVDRRIRTERLDLALAAAAGITLVDPSAPPAPQTPQTPPAPPAPPAGEAPAAD